MLENNNEPLSLTDAVYVQLVLQRNLWQSYTYLAPASIQVQVGDVVEVDFNRRRNIAIVVGFSTAEEIQHLQDNNIQAKSILKLVYAQYFSNELLKLLLFSADYYLTPMGQVLFSALPIKLRKVHMEVEKLKISYELTALGKEVLANSSLLKDNNYLISLVEKYQNSNLLDYKSIYSKSLEKISQGDSFSKGVSFNYLLNNAFISEKKEKIISEPSYLQKANWSDISPDAMVNNHNKHQLNAEQELAYNSITQQNGFNVFVIDGVTGSGKTEVYLQLIEYYLKRKQTALVLVPEIGLTPQTISRFANRFHVPIEILHSNVVDNKRFAVAQEAKFGKLAIVIGTRSAIFTDLSDVGIIIVDEEHDSSYKQQNQFRYNARDLAILRAKIHNVPVVLGSATPSFSTVNNILKHKFQHLILTQKAASTKNTDLTIINAFNHPKEGGLTSVLIEKIQQHTAAGNQALIFLNRRGYAPILKCNNCDFEFICTGCDRPFVYHRLSRSLECHFCEISRPLPHVCTNCGSTELSIKGNGTEQIEHAMLKYYSSEEIVRIDRDTVKNMNSFNEKFEKIHKNIAKVLIGTQMLAKGHHFPNVTLVAIVNLDPLLLNTNAYAAESLAQTYIQISGRTGRENKLGQVYLQTMVPHDIMLQDVISLNYMSFAKKYINLRNLSYNNSWIYRGYIALIHTDLGRLEDQVLFCTQLLHFLKNKLFPDRKILANNDEEFTIIDGGKLKQKYKYIIEVSSNNRKYINILLKEFIYEIDAKYKNIHFYIDIDPIGF